LSPGFSNSHIFMGYLLFSTIAFFVTIGLHVFIFRTFGIFTKRKNKLYSVFVIGFIIHSAIVFGFFPISLLRNGEFLPLTSSCLYILLCMIYLIYFLATFSGEEGPSLKIYLMMRRYKKRNYHQISKQFSQHEVVEKRLNSLTCEGFVRYENNRYYVNKPGKRLVRLIESYRTILGWHSSG
jgi:hypothetical protein